MGPEQTAADFEKDAIKEALAIVRYWGTVRFAALPLFMTVMGALAKAYFDPGTAQYPQGALCLTGIVLTLVLGWMEIVFTRNIVVTYRTLGTANTFVRAWAPVLAHRRSSWFHAITRWALMLPYCGGAWFWTYHGLLRVLPKSAWDGIALYASLPPGLMVLLAWLAWRSVIEPETFARVAPPGLEEGPRSTGLASPPTPVPVLQENEALAADRIADQNVLAEPVEAPAPLAEKTS